MMRAVDPKRVPVRWHVSSQDAFDSAFQYPDFLLQQRVADVMLNVSEAQCRQAILLALEMNLNT
eukprot:324424-Pelagomonas_calceolata.AAC.3